MKYLRLYNVSIHRNIYQDRLINKYARKKKAKTPESRSHGGLSKIKKNLSSLKNRLLVTFSDFFSLSHSICLSISLSLSLFLSLSLSQSLCLSVSHSHSLSLILFFYLLLYQKKFYILVYVCMYTRIRIRV